MSRAPIKRCKFTVILEAEGDGGYSVHCPALPGCVSQGDDRRSALANVKEAIELVLAVSVERSAEMPNSEGASPFYLETPARIAEEIREVLKGREQDGLPFAGISLEQVEIVVKALPQMPPLPVISGREAVRAFEQAGWQQVRQTGSHIILTKTSVAANLSVPDHRTLRRGTLRGLIRKSGLAVEEFVELLQG